MARNRNTNVRLTHLKNIYEAQGCRESESLPLPDVQPTPINFPRLMLLMVVQSIPLHFFDPSYSRDLSL
jgi:hypothetical protein